jgi:hypothetical protein
MMSKRPRSVPVRARRLTISQAWADPAGTVLEMAGLAQLYVELFARLDRGGAPRIRVLGGLVELLHGRRGFLLRPVGKLDRLVVECLHENDFAFASRSGWLCA